MAKEYTPSWGSLFSERARELQQTVWSLNNRLFCVGCFKKAKDFFCVCLTRMPEKIVPGERKHLEGQFAT